MARLPTVTLRRKSDGAIRIYNATDFASDLYGFASNFTLIGTSDGDATDAQVRFAARQAEVEILRKQNPLAIASQDDRRDFEARRVTATIETASEVIESVETETETVVADEVATETTVVDETATESVSDMSDNSEIAVEVAIDETIKKVGPVVAAGRSGRPPVRKAK